jgi:hypothetical protein
MSSVLEGNTIMPGKYNNYLIGGNLTNTFIIGNLSDPNDFHLVGAEPEDESSYPLISGTILDSEGSVLFRLVRNILILNPGNCSKIYGDHIGYEIHDSAGELIFKVDTKFEKVPKLNEEYFITRITANLYNKKCEKVFEATNDEPGSRIISNTQSVFGFSGNSCGIVSGMNADDIDIAKIYLASKGRINKILTGTVTNETINLDGCLLKNATIDNCTVRVNTGDFLFMGNKNQLSNSRFEFGGLASNIRNLVLKLENPNKGL